jgi:class 3 adenylate cyclase
MTSQPELATMTSSNVGVSWPALQRVRRTVVMVDMVESVRLIEAHEEDTVRRWQRFVSEVSTQVLPAQHGRLVKSLGDGLLCEFEDARPAVASALHMQQAAWRLNDGYPAEQAIHLRIGAHTPPTSSSISTTSTAAESTTRRG